MKFSNLIFLLAAFQLFAEGNETGCVTEVEDGKDFFPYKVTPEDSLQWSVSYEDTYKIVTSAAAGETYLLYQCGTQPPADQLDGRHAAVLSVPLQDVGVLYTTQLPFLELLGEREKISAFLGSMDWVSSPCVNDLFDQGLLEEVPDPYNATTIANISLTLPSFVGMEGGTAMTTEIKESTAEETTNLAAFEWIKFYSLFFNMEETANQIYNATKARYGCVQDNAALLSCGDETKPVLLWASYSTFCEGWDVAMCPNYYCEFAEICEVKLLNSEDGGSFYSEDCVRNYMTTDEFITFGKDADIWIYTSSDFDYAFATFGADLADFVSIKNEKVYDTEGQGPDAWFERRLSEPGKWLFPCANVRSLYSSS